MAEWTEVDLDIMQSLDAAQVPIEQIARRLGRRPEDIERELPIVRSRKGTLPIPTRCDDDGEQQWLGPDEEGDVEPIRDSNDTAAWVHADPTNNSKLP